MGLTLPLKLAAEKLVWAKIRDGVGGRVKVVVSGGSSLPSFLEDFFEMAGVRCVDGYCRPCAGPAFVFLEGWSHRGGCSLCFSLSPALNSVQYCSTAKGM